MAPEGFVIYYERLMEFYHALMIFIELLHHFLSLAALVPINIESIIPQYIIQDFIFCVAQTGKRNHVGLKHEGK